MFFSFICVLSAWLSGEMSKSCGSPSNTLLCMWLCTMYIGHSFFVLTNYSFWLLQKEQHSILMENIRTAWQNLQGRVNGIYDNRLAKIFTDSRPSYGVKQVTVTKWQSVEVFKTVLITLSSMLLTRADAKHQLSTCQWWIYFKECWSRLVCFELVDTSVHCRSISKLV